MCGFLQSKFSVFNMFMFMKIMCMFMISIPQRAVKKTNR